MTWVHLGPDQGKLVGSCERGNEQQSLIKFVEILGEPRDYQITRPSRVSFVFIMRTSFIFVRTK